MFIGGVRNGSAFFVFQNYECLYIESRESFLKYQDVQWIYSVRFCMTKPMMLASYLDFRNLR
jgi:hypothetical protein